MDKTKFVFRSYKISINIGPFFTNSNTRVYRLRRIFVPYLVGFLYSILNILTGFWSWGIVIRRKGIRNTLEALHYNLSGGVDMSRQAEEEEYDDRTNYLYNNLYRETKEKVTREEVEIISEIYDLFVETKGGDYPDNIEYFILLQLSKVEIHSIQRVEIRDILEAIKMYEESLESEIHFA